MTSDESPDPRAKYRSLPPTVDPATTFESVDPETEVADEPDDNEGARPYLRMTFGSWVR